MNNNAFNFQSREAYIVSMIDAVSKQEQEDRDYLGASAIGRPCEREIYYMTTHTPKDEGSEFPARIERVFMRGHWSEDYMASLLIKAGFDLKTSPIDGVSSQYEVVYPYKDTCIYQCKGHLDGIITAKGIPGVPDGMRMVWEHKMLNNANFTKLKAKPLSFVKPVYYAQVQFYMAYMPKDLCMFTAMNADTMEILVKFVRPNPQFMVDLNAKIERLLLALMAKEAPPRIPESDSAWSPCRFCSWKARCRR